jgi:hypothetical protein
MAMHKYTNTLLLPYGHAVSGWSPNLPYIPKEFPFEPNDTEYLYAANLKRQPDNWYYKDHRVSYTWNSNGYRAPEWREIDWASSWIIMGCSHVTGIGVAFEDTISEQLSKLINTPVVNLGVGGSSIDVAFYNSLRLIDSDIKPLGVIIVSPNLERMTYWQEQTTVNLNPNFNCPDQYINNAYRGWLRYEPNAELHGYLKLRGLLACWHQVGIPVIPCYVDKARDPTHNIGLHLPPRQDWARDIDQHGDQMSGHFGRATLGSWARAIAAEIQKG